MFRGGELLLDPTRRALDRVAIIWTQRGAPPPRLIHHINRIAAFQEKLCPALAAVRRAREVGAALAAALDHHNRKWVGTVFGDLVLDIGLARHVFAVRAIDIVPTGENISLAGDFESRPISRQS